MRLGQATNLTELIQAAEEARTRRIELRLGWETQWWQNLLMLSGDHFAQWDPTLARMSVPMATKDDHVRLALNHTLTVARTELARLTKTRPRMDVMPNSDESEDIAAAKVAISVLDYGEWRHQLGKLRKQATWWMIGTGMAAIFVGFDEDDEKEGQEEYMVDPETNEVTHDPDRQKELMQLFEQGLIPEPEAEVHAYGDCEFRVYSPFQLLPDETVLEWSEIKDLITEDAVDLDKAEGKWGKKDQLQPDQVNLGTMERRMLARASLNTTKDLSASNCVQVHTLWLVPGEFPGNKFLNEGVMLRWCNKGTVLEFHKRYPYRDNRIPFAFYQHIPSAVSIWPESIIQHIRGANLEMDRIVSQLIENKDYMANPGWRVAVQHQIKGKIKNKAGAILRYVHVPNIPPPEPILGVPMPSQVQELMLQMRQEILEISGQGEISRGSVPTGVRSGVQVAYLQEEEEGKIGPTVESIEEATAMLSSLYLSRVGQFYTQERLLRIYRSDGRFDVIAFKGSDLKGSTDVVPVPGSALPKSKAAKQQFALELAQMGIETDPKKLRDMLELGEGEPDDVDKALAQAQRENAMMSVGVKMQLLPTAPEVNPDTGEPEVNPETGEPMEVPQAIPVEAWHNHQAHLKRHYSFMMDEAFEKMSTEQPIVKKLFQEHTAMHEQIVQQQQMQQAQMAQMMAGSAEGSQPSPESGEPSPNGGPPPAGDVMSTEADASVAAQQ